MLPHGDGRHLRSGALPQGRSASSSVSRSPPRSLVLLSQCAAAQVREAVRDCNDAVAVHLLPGLLGLVAAGLAATKAYTSQIMPEGFKHGALYGGGGVLLLTVRTTPLSLPCGPASLKEGASTHLTSLPPSYRRTLWAAASCCCGRWCRRSSCALSCARWRTGACWPRSAFRVSSRSAARAAALRRRRQRRVTTRQPPLRVHSPRISRVARPLQSWYELETISLSAEE